jgi:hypothetical protein
LSQAVQWWGALTQQFQQIAAKAMAEPVPPETLAAAQRATEMASGFAKSTMEKVMAQAAALALQLQRKVRQRAPRQPSPGLHARRPRPVNPKRQPARRQPLKKLLPSSLPPKRLQPKPLLPRASPEQTLPAKVENRGCKASTLQQEQEGLCHCFPSLMPAMKTGAAAEQVVLQLREATAAPVTAATGWGLVYIAQGLVPHAQQLLALLARELPQVTDWVGSSGHAVLAMEHEYSESSSLAVMLLDLPAAHYRVYSGVAPLAQSGAEAGFEAHSALVHSSIDQPDLAELLLELSERISSGNLFRALSSEQGVQFACRARICPGCVPGQRRHLSCRLWGWPSMPTWPASQAGAGLCALGRGIAITEPEARWCWSWKASPPCPDCCRCWMWKPAPAPAAAGRLRCPSCARPRPRLPRWAGV